MWATIPPTDPLAPGADAAAEPGKPAESASQRSSAPSPCPYYAPGEAASPRNQSSNLIDGTRFITKEAIADHRFSPFDFENRASVVGFCPEFPPNPFVIHFRAGGASCRS